MAPVVVEENGMRIYKPPKDYHLPNIDLLTFVFDSEFSTATDAAPLHTWAHDTSNIITKGDLRTAIRRVAYYLRNEHGIGASGPNKDVVVCVSSFQPVLPAIFFGVIAAGGVYSAASHSFIAEELARQTRGGPAKLLVCCEKTEQVARDAAKAVGLDSSKVLVLKSGAGRTPASLRALDGKGQNPLAPGAGELGWPKITDEKELRDSLILLLYSSGTTGVPKGVRLSHSNLVSEFMLPIFQTVDIVEQQVKKGLPAPEPFELRTLAHIPTAHIAGLASYFISPPLTGTLTFWMPRYSFKPFIEYAKKHRVTALWTVPSIFLSIAKSPLVTDHFDWLRMAVTGAAKMDGDLQKAANAKLGGYWKREGKGGTFIGQTWGMSETTGAVTRVTVDEVDDTGSIAPIMPNMEIRLVDDEGKDVPRGEAGEIIVSGPVVSNGYHNNDKANKDTFVMEGGRRWIRTGDIVQEIEGKFYVVDRKKELIKYKGLQIPPAELEGLLDTHPGILEAAVIGVPDSQDSSSELPRAYVVVADKNLTEDAIKEWIAGKVAPYKQLRGGVAFMDALPKNAVGKLLRRTLRDAAIKSSRSGAKL